ncbi:hypothetical protein [Streptomyces scabiei]|uniref:hypothetical protein n=1 Tax=Streptomyces scabiei TaxID=1930 RepID=UPI0029A9C72B|nr:hypothetical protein [Streptomyces scabiei]MDX3126566.1 hypothetical protein [Streptomyces scabiei]MDX3203023.1 hypothetical protein [Streptomyces scabiei]MDX3223146.1 hypothetical protein [Streptomyces scabiei]
MTDTQTPEPCTTCDADDRAACGCCPACDTTKDELCVACGLCRCDRHDDCVRPKAGAPAVVRSAAAVLAVEHPAVALNQYGRCTGAGFRVAEGPDGRARVSHQAPPVDLLDPDRPSSEERWEDQRRAVDEYARTLEAVGWAVERKTVLTEPIALAVPPEGDMAQQRIEIGVRVWGEVRGQQFTGSVVSTSSRGGSSALRDGRLVTIDPGVLEHVHVATDNELTTPAGRRVSGVHLRGAAEIAGLVVLSPVEAEAAEEDQLTAMLRLGNASRDQVRNLAELTERVHGSGAAERVWELAETWPDVTENTTEPPY